MSDLQIIGPQWGSLGSPKPFTSGPSGGQRTQDAHGRFLDAVLGNRMFYIPFAAAAPSAYVGAAGGTPLVCVHNPASSGKLLVAAAASIAQRATATAAGTTGLNLWSGPSAIPTQATITVPINALSQTVGGSVAKGFTNVALTGSTALQLALSLFTHYWATAAAAFSTPGLFDIGGIVVAPPGGQICMGLTVVPTSVTVDGVLYWEEIPYLPMG